MSQDDIKNVQKEIDTYEGRIQEAQIYPTLCYNQKLNRVNVLTQQIAEAQTKLDQLNGQLLEAQHQSKGNLRPNHLADLKSWKEKQEQRLTYLR